MFLRLFEEACFSWLLHQVFGKFMITFVTDPGAIFHTCYLPLFALFTDFDTFLHKACTRNKCERISTSSFFSGCIKIFLIAFYFVYNVLWFQKNMLVFGFNLKLVLKMTKEEDVREKIMNKYLQNPNSSYNSIAKSLHHPYTVSHVILTKIAFDFFSQTKSIKRKSGGGRKEGFKDIKLVRKLVNSFKNKPSLSLRECAKIYGFFHSFVAKVKNKHGFHSFKAKKVPHRSLQNSTKKCKNLQQKVV